MSERTSMDPAHVPDGFRPARLGGDFVHHNGPLYGRVNPDGTVDLGFRVQQRHCNPVAICHGGMLATFADMLVPSAMMYLPGRERRFLPTVSLQVDYLGAARLGAWVQGRGEILRITRNLVFGQALAQADGEPALRVSGVFKIGQPYGDPDDPDPMRLR